MIPFFAGLVLGRALAEMFKRPPPPEQLYEVRLSKKEHEDLRLLLKGKSVPLLSKQAVLRRLDEAEGWPPAAADLERWEQKARQRKQSLAELIEDHPWDAP